MSPHFPVFYLLHGAMDCDDSWTTVGRAGFILDNLIADQSTAEDAPFSFTVPANTFSDVDASDTLIYTTTLSDDSPLPAWLSFDGATRTFSGTPTNGDLGTISVKVTADDGSTYRLRPPATAPAIPEKGFVFKAEGYLPPPAALVTEGCGKLRACRA